VLTLRPHHLTDILTDYDPDREVKPWPSGNAVHVVTRMLADGLDQKAKFVIGSDDICRPCRRLQPDGSCDKILDKHNPPEPIDEYNDRLDQRLLDFLGLTVGGELTLREFFEIVNSRTPGIEAVCTHPTQNPEDRLNGLIRGLVNLGIREESGEPHSGNNE
jgi:hypothetical protein